MMLGKTLEDDLSSQLWELYISEFGSSMMYYDLTAPIIIALIGKGGVNDVGKFNEKTIL